jgi:hypothetical protein
MMRFWIGPALLAMFVWPRWGEEQAWPGNGHDIYIFEAQQGRAIAVVTPDPFFDETDWGMRIWRADVHMRVGETTVSREITFRAERVEEDTVVFLETAWGPEIHIFEAHPDVAPGHHHRCRWVARPHGLEELNPARGYGPFSTVRAH